MKKNLTILIVVIVIVILAVGGYFAVHKNKAKAPTVNSTTTTTAVNNSVLVTKTNSSVGQYLADPSGQALYTYGGDTNGVSNCKGSCLASWPAYQDKGSTTGLPTGVATIKRTDNGQIQFTYTGLPLYTFVNDTPGQVTGNGVSNFSVAKPSSQTPATSSSTSSKSNYSY